MKQQLIVSAKSFTETLFKFVDSPRGRARADHKQFIQDMVFGIIGGKSPLLGNISRFLSEDIELIHTEQRLSRLLRSNSLEWEQLAERQTEVAIRGVRNEDVIAFDPGDIVKPYAEKMENLYRVHDGSEDVCGNGMRNSELRLCNGSTEESFTSRCIQKYQMHPLRIILDRISKLFKSSEKFKNSRKGAVYGPLIGRMTEARYLPVLCSFSI